MARFSVAVVLVLLVVLGGTRPTRAADVAEFADFSLTNGSGGVVLPGRLFIPPEAIADPSTPRPLILFLHGAGQRGTNNTSQVAGLNGLFTATKDRGAFLYAPQITNDWHHATPQIGQMLDRALADYNVDVDRMYVTGISLGGGGTWSILSSMPNRFAAGMPVSGTGGAPQAFNLLKQTIWSFHSRDDDVVSVNTTRGIIAQMLFFAGEPLPDFPSHSDATTTLDFISTKIDLRYTEYPTGGHGVGSSRIYRDPAVYDWMFSQTLAVPEPSTWVMFATGTVLLAFQAWRRRVLRASRRIA